MTRAALAITLALSAAFAGAAAALAPPNAATIAHLESRLTLPKGAWPFARYDRWYAYSTRAGRQVIEGRLLATRITDDRAAFKAGRKTNGEFSARAGRATGVASPAQFPMSIYDGGCEEMNLVFDVKADRIVALDCNGLG